MSKALASFIAVTVLLMGCQTVRPVEPTVACDFTPMLTAQQNPGPALAPPLAGSMTVVPLNAVSMTDAAITNKVLVQQVMASRTETGTVRVATRLFNCTDFPLQVEGRTHFLDQGNAPVEPVSAWQRVYMPARAIATYTETSIDVHNITSYLIELREGV